jgi:hypothetical protein
MGFRDLEVFNTAPLVKQGWRILQHLKSLVAIVLKEKYFLGGSFLQASLGYNPSYAWRNIIKAREMLERGLIWRVRNGESNRVWGNKWLIGNPPYKVQSIVLDWNPDMRVCDLIDRDSGWWKVGAIRDFFLSSDVEAICNLALSPLRNPDKLVWMGTSNGYFSVKSSYHQEMAKRGQERG